MLLATVSDLHRTEVALTVDIVANAILKVDPLERVCSDPLIEEIGQLVQIGVSHLRRVIDKKVHGALGALKPVRRSEKVREVAVVEGDMCNGGLVEGEETGEKEVDGDGVRSVVGHAEEVLAVLDCVGKSWRVW